MKRRAFLGGLLSAPLRVSQGTDILVSDVCDVVIGPLVPARDFVTIQAVFSSVSGVPIRLLQGCTAELYEFDFT